MGSREYPAAGSRHAVGSVLMGGRSTRPALATLCPELRGRHYQPGLPMVVAGGGAGSVRPAPVSRSPRTVFPMAARGTGHRASPVCTLAAVAAALTLCAMLSPLYEAPPNLPAGPTHPPERGPPQRKRPPIPGRRPPPQPRPPRPQPLRPPHPRRRLRLPRPLNGVSRTTRSVAKMRARRDAAGSRRGGVRRDRRGDALWRPAWIGAERPPRE